MRIATVLASDHGFRTPRANAQRIDVGRELIAWARQSKVCLLAFPAGYLRAADERPRTIESVAAPLLRDAERAGLALLVGVDACPRGWAGKRSYASLVRNGRLPLFAVGFAPGQPPQIWRQRSTTSTNWKSVPASESQQVRSLPVGRDRAAVVLCGEAFNRDVRDAIDAAGVPLAILIAHGAAGLRH